jgi:phenylalanyl-tRNA synthetase alpha chain
MQKKKNEIEAARVKYLGKKGELTAILKGMRTLSSEERPVIGQLANEVRSYIEELIEKALNSVEIEAMKARLQNEVIDVTMPGKKRPWAKSIP